MRVRTACSISERRTLRRAKRAVRASLSSVAIALAIQRHVKRLFGPHAAVEGLHLDLWGGTVRRAADPHVCSGVAFAGEVRGHLGATGGEALGGDAVDAAEGAFFDRGDRLGE